MAITLFTLTNVAFGKVGPDETNVCPTAFRTMEDAVQAARTEWDEMTDCDGDFDTDFVREDMDGTARFINRDFDACYLVTRVTLD